MIMTVTKSSSDGGDHTVHTKKKCVHDSCAESRLLTWPLQQHSERLLGRVSPQPKHGAPGFLPNADHSEPRVDALVQALDERLAGLVSDRLRFILLIIFLL